VNTNLPGANAPTVEKPVIEIMKKFEARMGKQKRTVSVGAMQLEVGGFRSQIAKILGTDHPAMTVFPKFVVGSVTPANVAEYAESMQARMIEVIRHLEALSINSQPGSKVFFGHGRSPVWRELKDFVHDRLGLDWEEFNREAVAGLATTERLHDMLQSAQFAFLLMTADDELADGTPQARPNVIHEIGLFQGKLGMRRAIVLLEEGCPEFSNIVGLSQIRFPKGRISACFEEVRQVLAREGIVARS
jgi:predicted nucleotide-binding protein